MNMIGLSVNHEQVWTSMQKPRRSSYIPAAYWMLLSAIDNGWQIDGIELTPSWDQFGFVYLVNLSRPLQNHHQQLILPMNPVVENLLVEQFSSSLPATVKNFQLVQI
jgi:hypothetical protein